MIKLIAEIIKVGNELQKKMDTRMRRGQIDTRLSEIEAKMHTRMSGVQEKWMQE